jgi:hypothetical protein
MERCSHLCCKIKKLEKVKIGAVAALSLGGGFFFFFFFSFKPTLGIELGHSVDSPVRLPSIAGYSYLPFYLTKI